jgi:alpha-N-acetylglucosamine transferase
MFVKHDSNNSRPAMFTYVCSAVNDKYLAGCYVVAKSVVLSGSLRDNIHFTVLALEQVTQHGYDMMKNVHPAVSIIRISANPIPNNKRYSYCFAKLHAWNLTQYEKAVFLDSDLIVLNDISTAFEKPELTAASDNYQSLIGNAHIFSTAFFVLVPSKNTFTRLMRTLYSHPRFGKVFFDMDFLNDVYKNWKPLPANTLILNWHVAMPGMLIKPLLQNAKVVHFSGPKPFNMLNKPSKHLQHDLLLLFDTFWWEIFCASQTNSTIKIMLRACCSRLVST